MRGAIPATVLIAFELTLSDWVDCADRVQRGDGWNSGCAWAGTDMIGGAFARRTDDLFEVVDAIGDSRRAGDRPPAGDDLRGTDNAGAATGSTSRAPGWDLPLGGGGATIGGRRYTEHALERMAPRTPEVMATLEARALERAEAAGLSPGTRTFADWWADHGPDPRGVPPSVVEAEIQNPGSTSVRVITNSDGGVVTVIPR